MVETLESGLSQLRNQPVRISELQREVCPFVSSFLAEHLRVLLDTGESVPVFFKDMNPHHQVKTAQIVRGDSMAPSYHELHVYQQILAGADLGTPQLYAVRWEPDKGIFWFFFEDVGNSRLRDSRNFQRWIPAARWAAGEARAPAFRLRDADGRPVSPAQYRGRLLLVTFLDPLCKTFCPRESAVLDDALARLPAARRPAVIAVSVNPPVRSPAILRREARRFGWSPQWRWALGSERQLAAVWRSYHIAVLPTKGDVAHTEAAYVVDADGYERALFLWPFRARAVERTLRALAPASS